MCVWVFNTHQYTSIVITPFFLVTRVSKKAIWLLFFVLVVNEILGSMEFKMSWKAETESFWMTTKHDYFHAEARYHKAIRVSHGFALTKG